MSNQCDSFRYRLIILFNTRERFSMEKERQLCIEKMLSLPSLLVHNCHDAYRFVSYTVPI